MRPTIIGPAVSHECSSSLHYRSGTSNRLIAIVPPFTDRRLSFATDRRQTVKCFTCSSWPDPCGAYNLLTSPSFTWSYYQEANTFKCIGTDNLNVTQLCRNVTLQLIRSHLLRPDQYTRIPRREVDDFICVPFFLFPVKARTA